MAGKATLSVATTLVIRGSTILGSSGRKAQTWKSAS